MPRKFILICPAGNEAEAKKHIPDIVDGKVSAPSKRVIGTAFMALGYVNEQQLDGVIDALDYADEGIFDRLLAANGNTSLGTLYRAGGALPLGEYGRKALETLQELASENRWVDMLIFCETGLLQAIVYAAIGEEHPHVKRVMGAILDPGDGFEVAFTDEWRALDATQLSKATVTV